MTVLKIEHDFKVNEQYIMGVLRSLSFHLFKIYGTDISDNRDICFILINSSQGLRDGDIIEIKIDSLGNVQYQKNTFIRIADYAKKLKERHRRRKNK